MEKPQNIKYIDHLNEEINTVEKQIRRLQSERDALKRLLNKAELYKVVAGSVKRKNSFEKQLVETIIKDSLGSSKQPVASSTLYGAVSERVSSLNESTFRSYLVRLKKQNKIKSVKGMRGYYTITT